MADNQSDNDFTQRHSSQPEDYQQILGQTFVKQQRLPVLSLGSTRYDKYALSRMGIPQIGAARRLDYILQRKSLKTAQDLYTYLPELRKLKGVGVTTFWAAVALLEAHGLDTRAKYRDFGTPTRIGSNPATVITFLALKARTKQRRRQK